MSMTITINKKKILNIAPYVITRTMGYGGIASLIKTEHGVGVRTTLYAGVTPGGDSSWVETLIPIAISPPSTGYKKIAWKAKLVSMDNVSGLWAWIIGAETVNGMHDGFGLRYGGDGSLVLYYGTGGTLSSTPVTPPAGWRPKDWHDYEIRWYSDHIELYIDGTQVASVNIAITRPLTPLVELGNENSEFHYIELIAMVDLRALLEEYLAELD